MMDSITVLHKHSITYLQQNDPTLTLRFRRRHRRVTKSQLTQAVMQLNEFSAQYGHLWPTNHTHRRSIQNTKETDVLSIQKLSEYFAIVLQQSRY